MTVIPAVQGSDRYVVGIASGTLSGRAVLVRVHGGRELAAIVHEYPHAVIERELAGTGRPLPPGWAPQHPEGRHEVLRTVLPAVLAVAGVDPAHLIGIATEEARLELRVGDRLLAEIGVPVTGNRYTWTAVAAELATALNGVHDLRLKLHGGFRLAGFGFTASGGTG
ncbi:MULTISPECIES: hypothetical protein [unclassified Streptomyces]|uniref:hypothetical protein n=1 Tax=unclassified Streptomyces TaxID=2593676 RepID=UPI00224E2AF2|nr:hypothetical protein [Streptomyces sp. NBC_00047]MCX5613050.1 hypothetical protein [Streptomyces sp. NBC_00047]